MNGIQLRIRVLIERVYKFLLIHDLVHILLIFRTFLYDFPFTALVLYKCTEFTLVSNFKIADA